MPVEFDETYVFKRKYNRGRLLKWTERKNWVFVIIERKEFTGRSNYAKTLTFLVNDRTKPTLHQIINNFVSEKCPLLLSDNFSSYKTLKRDYDWNHHMVNHSKNFVNPRRISVQNLMEDG